jgi:hypothetical protein
MLFVVAQTLFNQGFPPDSSANQSYPSNLIRFFIPAFLRKWISRASTRISVWKSLLVPWVPTIHGTLPGILDYRPRFTVCQVSLKFLGFCWRTLRFGVDA